MGRMSTWIIESFRHNPDLALFLALALGFLIGKLRLGSFELGSVTGSLLAGILVGQMNIAIDPIVRSVFFLLFLFAIGYSVGPQFVQGLKSDGLPQLLFAVLQCGVSLAVVYAMARALNYDLGEAAGLMAGSHTTTAALGVAGDAIEKTLLPVDAKNLALQAMPVAYAVTYIFGTAGAAVFLAFIGPKILGVDLVEQCKQLEKKLNANPSESHSFSMAEKFDIRAYRVESEKFIGKTVAEFESHFGSVRIFVERLRRRAELFRVTPSTILQNGDEIAIVAPTDIHVPDQIKAGPETFDRKLLDFPIDVLDVVVINAAIAGKKIIDVAQSDLGRRARGVYIRNITRSGIEIPFSPDVVINRGDVIQLIGIRDNVGRVADELGYADRPSSTTDMFYVCLGVVLGGILGTLTVRFRGIPFQLSAAVGVLLAGLVLGWLRSVTRSIGRIPSSALWLLQNWGLTAFAAALGIGVGPGFIVGIKKMGAMMVILGAMATTIPLIFGLLIGRFLFKFHPAVTLGATAGAQTSTASLAVIQSVAKSKTPVLGYSVPYAVASVLLTLWGAMIVKLLS